MSFSLTLQQRRHLTLSRQHNDPSPVTAGQVRLQVLYCAICRTDAKMWDQGHRDLVLPRIPGHEIAAIDERNGRLCTVWPGHSCGVCRYCLSGRDNLCDEMQILGFHVNGGFSDQVVVPQDSLIFAPDDIPPHLLCFAEPMACILNGLGALNLKPQERVIIYGGGVVGLATALACCALGAIPLVIEQSVAKIRHAQAFLHATGITAQKATNKSDFDAAINCCDNPIAFSLCVAKLRKGGRLCFFSGLKKNEELDANLLNLLHYKEAALFGAYGPRKEHMVQAVAFCSRHHQPLALLVERIIAPQEAAAVMDDILSSRPLKYLIDFTSNRAPAQPPSSPPRSQPARYAKAHPGNLCPSLTALIEKVQTPDAAIRVAAQKKIDLKTKPLSALGRIEELAVQLSAIQHTPLPEIRHPHLLVFAADHGVVEEGVSAYPAKVTRQMVLNFLNGGAAINVFCRQYGIELTVVDMGVDGDFDGHPQLVDRKVRKATRNFALEQAMSHEEALRALENGSAIFLDTHQATGCNLVGMGEMGIGNTSSASAIISAVTGIPAAAAAGRGTGVDDKGLARKIEVLEKALNLHQPDPSDALDILTKVGGYEIAGIAGATLAAAATGCCVILDGHISTAAGLIAYLLCPDIAPYLIAGHRSVEQGQQAALDYMGLQPLVDLKMRLGEGTGAALAMNLAELACRVMQEMASFDEAGIDSSI